MPVATAMNARCPAFRLPGARAGAVAAAVVGLLAGCQGPGGAGLEPAGTRERAQTDRWAQQTGWVLWYADPSGRFDVAAVRAHVPAVSRAVVAVIDPLAPSSRLGDDRQVQVVDMREADPRPFGAMRCSEFQSRALAALPPGVGSRVDLLWLPGLVPGALVQGPAEPTSEVVLYRTSWCDACDGARDLLRERGVSVRERDVERDPATVIELRLLEQAAGVSIDRVPVINVRGQLVIGFAVSRLATLLGEQI
jgi:glutaredoxin